MKPGRMAAVVPTRPMPTLLRQIWRQRQHDQERRDPRDLDSHLDAINIYADLPLSCISIGGEMKRSWTLILLTLVLTACIDAGGGSDSGSGGVTSTPTVIHNDLSTDQANGG